MKIAADKLSYWFFRLNGFLTSVNFVIHTERRGEAGTDVDILGVRFPYRAELFERPMMDHPKFTRITGRPYILIAEVKLSRCDLNGPWTRQERRNVHRVLRAVGVVPTEDVDEVATAIYNRGMCKREHYYISLACVGETENPDIKARYAEVPQFTWLEILSFIYRRFRQYRRVKAWHQHWDQTGHILWDTFEKSRDENEFVRSMRNHHP